MEFSLEVKKVCQKCRQINCPQHGALQEEIVILHDQKWYTHAAHLSLGEVDKC